MCGICGQYNFIRQDPVIQSDILRMTRTIAHRGPDDEGFYVSGPLGLGFRRLSIIDLSLGHQPMSNKDQSIWIVFNGEIYNFPELKNELLAHDHAFQTNSDTEVIIHGYEQWGIDVFNRLAGMFGLAIWDARDRSLIVARDAMGIKPIYYRLDNGRLYFGSEMRPVLAAQENAQRDIDPIALNLFLRYRYTPSPLTIYKNVSKLAPGTLLTIKNGEASVRRWYQYKPEPFSPMKRPSEAKAELLELYKMAVKRHLLSDVPVGLLLSGGLDSGLLLALMNLYGRDWQTYTVGYGKSYHDDELEDAKKTAERFSSKHTSVFISIAEFERALPKIISFLEEPIAASSIVPMYFVCERASQDIKVALVGQGPDELFGGYSRHLGLRYSNLWRRTPALFRNAASSMIQRLPRNEMLKRGVYALGIKDRLKNYQFIFSLLPGDDIDRLFRQGMIPSNAGDRILDSWKEFVPLIAEIDDLGGFQFIEVRSSLPDELLMYSDKLSMAHGLELRVPYLDRAIVEYAEKLSSSLKIRFGRRKWLHREVCRDFLPPEVLNSKKRGFAVNVVDDWFYNSMSKKMESYLLDDQSLMYRYLLHKPTAQLLHDHKAGKSDNHKVLFSLIVFEEWLRTN